MSREAVIERILSDGEKEAQDIVAEAEEAAARTVGEAQERADRAREETQAELEVRAKRISDGKAASARLESAKILLAEKRRVLDVIYERALKELLSLKEREALSLVQNLLSEYAQEGDEVVFARSFPFAEKAAQLPVFAEKGLKAAKERAEIAGGLLLRGALCDKDLSFESLLAFDREEHQSEIAERIFR